MDIETAAQHAIVRQAAFNGQGGLIAVDAKGNVTMPFNTEGMYRAAVSSRSPFYCYLSLEENGCIRIAIDRQAKILGG